MACTCEGTNKEKGLMRKYFLTSWMAIHVFLLLVVFMLVLGTQSFNAAAQATFAEFNQRQHVKAKEVARKIELYFETLAGELSALGKKIEIQSPDGEMLRDDAQSTFNQLQSLGLTGIAVIDADGVLQSVAGNPRLGDSEFPWMQYVPGAGGMTSRSTWNVAIAQPGNGETGEMTAVIAVPLFTQDQFSGFILGTVPLNVVAQRFVSDIKPSVNGFAFLIDDDYTLLWSPHLSLLGVDLLKESAGFLAFQQILQDMGAGESGTGEFVFYAIDESSGGFGEDHEAKLIAYSPVHLGSTTWSLGITAPKDEVRQSIHSVYLKQLAMVGAGILTILLGAAYFFVQSSRTRGLLKKEVETKTQELKTAHESLLTILDSMDAAVYVADMETYEVLFVNEYFVNIWGNMVGKPCWQSISADRKTPCEDCVNQKLLAAGGESGNVHGWESHNEVNGRWYTNRARAIRWIDGRTVRLTISIDITEQKQAERAVRTSEEKYRHLVESSPDAIVIQRDDGIVFANTASAKLFGVGTPEQLLGKSVLDFVLPENRAMLAERYNQSRDVAGKVSLIGQRVTRLDGARVDVDVTAIPIVYGDQPAIQAVFRDVTERKRAEEELVKLRKAVETSGEVIFMTDRDGIITYVNPEFTRLYGFSADEVVGKVTPRILKSGRMTQEEYKAFWDALLNKQIVKSEIFNRRKDGRLLIVESSANPILNEDGEIIGFLAIQRDISERKQAEDRIRQRNKELSALNAIAATVSQSFELEQIIHESLDEVLQLDVLGEEAYGMLFLLDEKSGTLELVAHRGVPDGHPCLTNPPRSGECICGRAVERGEVVISDGSLRDKYHTRTWAGLPDHKDVCLPLQARGNILGTLNVRLPAGQQIAQNDIELLKSVADQISVAIENARLRELRERAIVEERERIARELHDGLAQLLTYLNTKVIAARLRLRNRQLEETDEQLQQLEDATQTLFADVREAILDLRSAGDIGDEFPDLLADYIANFTKLSGLPVSMEFSPDAESIAIPTDIQLQLLRILQGSLSNVRKHASATRARVQLQVEDETLILTVSDNGSGFDPEEVKGQLRFGLRTMAERAESIGAELQVESEPGKGTRISVRWRLRG